MNKEKIGIDLKGRINRLDLAERNMLLSVFEAVINSIHAIEDVQIPNGEIQIKIERSPQSSIDFEQEVTALPEIIGFTIQDNGIGFNTLNYESFKKEYSTHKAERGGLGLGRFMWLKTFENIEIKSQYYENKQAYQRSFFFNLKTDNGIENHSLKSLDKIEQRKTEIKLKGYKDPYKSKCPKKSETIAKRIIEHCLVYFFDPKCPRITLKDPVGNDLVLNNYFEQLIIGNHYEDSFEVRNHKFNIRLLKWFEHEQFTMHRVSLCANHREVEYFNLNNILPDINTKIKDDESEKAYLIVCYIEGEYLDKNINDERTEIKFGNDDFFNKDLITKGDLYNAARPVINKYFEQQIEEFKNKKIERINSFISESAPQYGILKKYNSDFDDIVITEVTSDQDLDLKLYEKYQKLEFSARAEVVQLIQEETEESSKALKEKYQKIFEELSDINKSKLAQYVTHRKYILELFEKSLALNQENKYELEDTVHSIVYPTKTDSNEIDYNNQNLWIIDERLSFHKFLSSDKPLRSIDGFEGDSLSRPDLMIFNNPISYSEDEEAPFNSIVLVEFKRPMRKNYNDSDNNPIGQLYNYIREIRRGKKLTTDGRTYPIGEHTRFYCYLICDINDKLIELAENAQLERTFDGLGFFGYNKSLKCTIDIMPFDKVLSNAKKRNKVLFHKLGI